MTLKSFYFFKAITNTHPLTNPNVVICSDMLHDSVKLTDFGFSNVFEKDKTLQTSCGSLAYSAPEILLGEEYDASAVGLAILTVISAYINLHNCI